jgi:outer membrane protein OmpA-like peptidoglycan-associated protein
MTISGMRSGLFAGSFIAAAIIMAGASATHAAGASPVGVFRVPIVPHSSVIILPIPINFVANQTTFTPSGEEAMQELIEFAKQMLALKLVGHTAPRGGTYEDNMDLSRRRVIAVRDKLVESGVTAEITIAWKGDTEPFDVSALPYAGQLSQDEIWKLDDRVELVEPVQP